MRAAKSLLTALGLACLLATAGFSTSAEAITYRGKTGQGAAAGVAVGSRGEARRVSIDWTAGCGSNGARWKDATLTPGPFTSRRSVTRTGRYRVRSGRVVGSISARLRIRKVSPYRWEGTFRASVVARRRGKVVDRCAMATTRWHASIPRVDISIASEPGQFVFEGASAAYSSLRDPMRFTGDRNHVAISFKHEPFSEPSYILTVKAPGKSVLRPGTYLGARVAAFPGSAPGLDLDGNGRGCEEIFGQFTVQSSSFNRKGGVKSIRLSFVMRCEQPTAPALTGTFFYSR